MKADQATEAKRVAKVYQDIQVNPKIQKKEKVSKRRNLISEGKRRIEQI